MAPRLEPSAYRKRSNGSNDVPGMDHVPDLGQMHAERADIDGAAFSDALEPHFKALRESICQAHIQVSSRLLERICAVEKENRDLRSKLSPSVSTTLADTNDFRSSLAVSRSTSMMPSVMCAPNRASLDKLLHVGSFGSSEGSHGPDGRSVTASVPECAGSKASSEHGCVTFAEAVEEVGAGSKVEEEDPRQFHYILWDAWRAETEHDVITETSYELQHSTTIGDVDAPSAKETASHHNLFLMHSFLDGSNGSNYFVLNPGSNIYLAWQLAFIIVFCYELVLFPMDVFDMPKDGFIRLAGCFTASFWTADLVLSFFTGSFDQSGEYICTYKQLALLYVRSWFFPDALFCLSDWIFVMTSGSIFSITKPMRTLRITRLLRLMRLKKLRDAMRRMDDLVNSLYFAAIKNIIVNMAGILVLSHFFGCIWFWLGNQSWVDGYSSWVEQYDMDAYGWEYKYVTALHWSITQFTPGSMHVQPQNVPERTFAVMMLVMGMVIFSSIISNVTAATNSLKRITARYDTEMGVLRRFFRQESISNDLMIRVIKYADNVIKPKMSKVDTNDVELIRLLPRPLYMEVVLEIFDQDLVTLPFFAMLKALVPVVLSKVCCQCLTPINLPWRTELFSPGDKADAMFFQTQGKAEYYVGNLPCRKLDPQRNPAKSIPICEAVLWTPWHMHGCFVARTECELIQIDAAKFRSVMASHQRVMPLVQRYSAEFVAGLNKLLMEGASISDLISFDTAHDILHATPERRFEAGVSEGSPV